MEAVRIEAGIYEAVGTEDSVPIAGPVALPLPVWPVVLDLPALPSGEGTEAPWVAATAEPWPGDVAVHSSRDGATWRFDTLLSRRAVMGQTLTELHKAQAGLWDRGPGLEVRLVHGAISSVDDATVFAGGNTAVILDQDGTAEVFQFRDAELIGPETWSLCMRLRGLFGTEAAMPDVWPAGATLIVLDQSLVQVPLASGLLEGPRIYRIGPASKPVDHSSYVEISHQASGLALKPYRPAHLRAERQSDGAISVNWIRQTRVDGGNWVLSDVPLGEAYEAYRVRVLAGAALRREVSVTETNWTYSIADQAADGVGSSFTIEVVQISDRAGPGHSARIEING